MCFWNGTCSYIADLLYFQKVFNAIGIESLPRAPSQTRRTCSQPCVPWSCSGMARRSSIYSLMSVRRDREKLDVFSLWNTVPVTFLDILWNLFLPLKYLDHLFLIFWFHQVSPNQRFWLRLFPVLGVKKIPICLFILPTLLKSLLPRSFWTSLIVST